MWGLHTTLPVNQSLEPVHVESKSKLASEGENIGEVIGESDPTLPSLLSALAVLGLTTPGLNRPDRSGHCHVFLAVTKGTLVPPLETFQPLSWMGGSQPGAETPWDPLTSLNSWAGPLSLSVLSEFL